MKNVTDLLMEITASDPKAALILEHLLDLHAQGLLPQTHRILCEYIVRLEDHCDRLWDSYNQVQEEALSLGLKMRGEWHTEFLCKGGDMMAQILSEVLELDPLEQDQPPLEYYAACEFERRLNLLLSGETYEKETESANCKAESNGCHNAKCSSSET